MTVLVDDVRIIYDAAIDQHVERLRMFFEEVIEAELKRIKCIDMKGIKPLAYTIIIEAILKEAFKKIRIDCAEWGEDAIKQSIKTLKIYIDEAFERAKTDE